MSQKLKPGIKIAISGKSGCGNSTISRLTAARLGLKMINYTFHTIAEERQMDFRTFYKLADADGSWDLYLDNKQVELAASGNCVLGSRLAVWMLKDADLKVFLDAPVEVRASRIQKREGGDLAAVIKETTERDEHDRKRFIKLYKIDNSDFAFVDVVINASLTPDEIVDRIAEAAYKIT